MNVLIVWAHPEARSFNGALVDLARETLAAAGHAVRETDLYREGFAATATRSDFRTAADPNRFVYDAEQAAASVAAGFCDEIARSIEDLRWCDQLILQFPLWWFSVPAIMKGWIDRVMAKGVAYGGGRWYDRGGFAGRRALLSITTAAYPEMCAPDGINGAMDVILWPLQHGVLRFVGFEALRPHLSWSVPYADDVARRDVLESFRRRLIGLADEMPEPSHDRASFGRDWRLLPNIAPVTAGHRRVAADAPPD